MRFASKKNRRRAVEKKMRSLRREIERARTRGNKICKSLNKKRNKGRKKEGKDQQGERRRKNECRVKPSNFRQCFDGKPLETGNCNKTTRKEEAVAQLKLENSRGNSKEGRPVRH